MANVLGSLRRMLTAPPLAAVGFQRRGFPPAGPGGDPAVIRHLEAVPQAVICGFEWGIETTDQGELERRLDLVDPRLRGFGYEGATMAYTILDATTAGRPGRRTTNLLRGPGEPHLFLAYIGIGFAMARLPRPLWSRVLPDLTGSPYHPTMSWLAVDGYGFDLAYFDVERGVGQQRRPRPYPWLGRPDYFQRAADQGVGRALWFIHGARVDDVTAAVGAFATDRQADLWSGVGLAATFAGGSDAAALATLRDAAGRHRPDLAQGAVFAAKARVHAGYVPTHSRVAMAAFGDCGIEAAADLADATAVPEPVPEPVPVPEAAAGGGDAAPPAYERWRAAVRAHFEPVGPAGAQVRRRQSHS